MPGTASDLLTNILKRLCTHLHPALVHFNRIYFTVKFQQEITLVSSFLDNDLKQRLLRTEAFCSDMICHMQQVGVGRYASRLGESSSSVFVLL